MRIARLQSRPIRARPGLLGVLLAVLALAVAAPASADVGETIILRCTHGQSLRGFSQYAYNEALKELSADSEEYSPCSSQIRRAQAAAAIEGKQGGGGGSAAQTSANTPALTASPSERRDAAHAASTPPAGVSLGGELIHPGVVHASVASAFSSLPTPLLALLALLLACLLALLGGTLRNRIRARRAG